MLFRSWGANGDIITTGNITNYNPGGAAFPISGTANVTGFSNSTLLNFPGSTTQDPVDYAVTTTIINGVLTVTTESGPTNVAPNLDAFGVATNKYSAKVDIYDNMEPTGQVDLADLGALP